MCARTSCCSYQSLRLIGVKRTAVLYTYVVVGLGILKGITPNFEAMVKKSAAVEGTFRYGLTQKFAVHAHFALNAGPRVAQLHMRAHTTHCPTAHSDLLHASGLLCIAGTSSVA